MQQDILHAPFAKKTLKSISQTAALYSHGDKYVIFTLLYKYKASYKSCKSSKRGHYDENVVRLKHQCLFTLHQIVGAKKPAPETVHHHKIKLDDRELGAP